jgi:hypothetical protein
MTEAIFSSETSVLTRATWRNTSEDGILHSHRRENPNLYFVVEIHNLHAVVVRDIFTEEN